MSTSAHADRRMYYLPLYRASIEGDWIAAKQFFDSDPNALKAPINDDGGTALCVAAISACTTTFIEELVKLTEPQDLEIQDPNGFTPLHSVATNGNTKTAKILVQKNSNLTQMRNRYSETPLLRAVKYGHMDLVWYLCNVTKDQDPSPFRGQDGAELLIHTVDSNLYDIALHLLQLYPEMATTLNSVGNSAIFTLAEKSWPSINRDGFSFRRHYNNSMVEKLEAVFATASKQLVPSLRNSYDTKIMHRQYLKVVAYVCNEMARLNDITKIDRLTMYSARLASERGNVELIKSILKVNPYAIWVNNNNEQDHLMLHTAVKNRQVDVFNYLKQLGIKDEWACHTDGSCNENILHLAAKLGPSSKLKLISGAALQVQYELQWYKELENIVQPSFRNNINRNGENPRQVFTKQHKELVEKGEKWMKGMASSSMVVATLIATVVFAAAFTVPGGNRSDIGIPIFRNTSAYMIFAVSNALAFFSSLTSVLMFLSILTARYAEEDFLRSLPQKLIIGHTMLLFAIGTMTIAFCATYFIMLGKHLAWLSILIALLTCFPVALFAYSQLPLLREMIKSTYKSSL